MVEVFSNLICVFQVGSHYHFIETNKRLVFDRAAAYGYRLVTLYLYKHYEFQNKFKPPMKHISGVK